MMASIADDDFCSLAEEKFDFDVPLSPASSKGEDDVEDEVFLGPISHMERCISHGVETKVKDSVSSGPSVGEEPSWSPLLEENFEEIRKEAHLLASHLERTSTDPVSEGITVTSNLPENAEQFEADTGAKLDMFSKRSDALSPIKRETFCVQDSPMKQLPPAIQKRLQKVCVMSGGKQRLSTSSPVRHADTQPKMAPRGRSLMASNGVLPSKPIAMGNPRLSTCTRPAASSKTRLPAPSKNSFGLKRSPGSINTSKAGSTEDLLSDTASVASDVSDSSFNTSLPGKRGLSASHKTEKRGAPVCKAPTLPNRRVGDRSRNTSSSSSSVSSINSSLSVSPTGKLNSSLNTSVSSISGRVPNSGSRLPSSSRKSGIITRPVEPSVGRRTSLSTQVRKSSEPLPRPVKATPIKRQETVSSVQHQTPAKKTMERTISVPIITTKSVSSVKVNSSSKAFVAPTPTNSLKGVRRSEVISSPDVPRIMKPKRLMSACSVESLPQRLTVPAPQGLQTPSAAAGMPVQSKLRRPSALPTPVTRRVSGIPMLTPKSVPRLSRSSRTPERQSPASASEMSHASPCQLKQSEQQGVVEQALANEEPCAPTELQPCSLVFNLEDDANRPTVCEPAAVEKASTLSTEGLEPQQPKPEVITLAKSEEILQNHQKNKPVMQEVLLVDAPAPVLKPEEKVLIDLANTPDLIKTVPNKVFGGQLIDLSSPLIKWSPEEKKENAVTEAPLINLSF
ncbi:G2 and S phase-expressed protein 1 isoform X2 [Colossoma macropomum]|uniref:G2 and S phase-expressed protein 1 isoform X2 n=1 Tax=Colossoma macropomum TaxID=42526 RepID=UPI001864722E|nr:G2 and S phase-expressed protein 1 isoform X2 [Colossoma macropomum]